MISIENFWEKVYAVLRNDHFVVGLILFITFSLLSGDIFSSFILILAISFFTVTFDLGKVLIGKRKHQSIHNSILFKELKKSGFRTEKFGGYLGLTGNIDGRTIQIFYDWKKYAAGTFSFGDIVINIFYEPLIEKYNDFEVKIEVLHGLSDKYYKSRFHRSQQSFDVDRMIVNINYYPRTSHKKVLRKIHESIKIIESENLAPFDIENLKGRFKKQKEEYFFLPNMRLVQEEIERGSIPPSQSPT
ncbi:MAG: hypothetical protein ACJA0U_001656 [Salibacteraceae bacterium]|jgi:hypothetical protein